MDNADANLTLLQIADGAQLLDGIDKLRSHGINQYVSLPQIVVVGDQSSGKSSVLEAISGVAFPTNEGRCTQFATEVILRRSRNEKASAKIRPSAVPNLERTEKLESFRQTKVALTEVAGLIVKAQNHMEMPAKSNFSKDVLELEICGPQQPHLTLVDLPGLFHTTRPNQNEGDKSLVDSLVKKYMEQPRTIILAIVAAQNDIANQSILEFLKSIDPKGKRTMGVITKPDRIPSASANEVDFIRLAQNSEYPLHLGWHVLRNPSLEDRRDYGFDRDETEKEFFANKAPWNELPASQVGVTALRMRLSRLLMSHITSELPELAKNIESELALCRTALQKMGPQRATTQEKRIFLSEIGERFQRYVKEAADGRYESSFVQLSDNKLRANIRKAQYEFANHITKYGHLWEIVDGEVIDAWIEFKSASLSDSSIPLGLFKAERIPSPARRVSKSNYTKMVFKEIIEECRGRELPGSYDPMLIRTLFQKQSTRWEELARAHTAEVFSKVKRFIEVTIAEVAGPERADVLLLRLLDPALNLRQAKLEAKVDELLEPYTDGHPFTLNPEFATKLASQNKTDRSWPEDDSEGMDLLAASRIVDTMQCYYKIALATFVDNLANLAIENCLLKGVENLLSPMSITRMSDSELDQLGSESPEDAIKREEKVSKEKVLEAGLATCRQYITTRQRPSNDATTPSASRGSKSALAFGTGGSTSTAALSSGLLTPARAVKSQPVMANTPSAKSSSSAASPLGRVEEQRVLPQLTSNIFSNEASTSNKSPANDYIGRADQNAGSGNKSPGFGKRDAPSFFASRYQDPSFGESTAPSGFGPGNKSPGFEKSATSFPFGSANSSSLLGTGTSTSLGGQSVSAARVGDTGLDATNVHPKSQLKTFHAIGSRKGFITPPKTNFEQLLGAYGGFPIEENENAGSISAHPMFQTMSHEEIQLTDRKELDRWCQTNDLGDRWRPVWAS